MKRFSKIIVWAMLSVMMQCAGLLYIDKVMLKESSEFTAETVEITTKKVEANVSIPTNAEKVEVSFDGRFITYYMDKKLMLVNIKTSEITEILQDEEILFTTWAPNTNMIIVAEKLSGEVNVKTYNPKTEFETIIGAVCPYKKGMEISNMVVSAKTQTTYMCVSNGGNSATIYRLGIEKDDIKAIDKKVPTLGSIKAFPRNDVLLYEDSLNKSFYRYKNGSRKKLNFTNSDSLVILGATSDDMIYMGESSEGKVAKIIYGVDETSPATWKIETLEKSKDIKDIYINVNSQILVNNSLEGKVKNITTGEAITYEGKLISINNKVICSSTDGKIYIKSVTDVDKKEETTSKK